MSNLAIQAFTCSPQKNGNSDNATRLFAQGVTEAGGKVDIVNLRDYKVNHCISCHHCDRDPYGACSLAGKDQSAELFKLILEAPMLFFASPIYFYHVPSLFKTFIDRSQAYWVRHAKKDPFMMNLPARTAHLVMMGARRQGERLFDGSILTMQYFLHPFNITLAAPNVFYGKEGPRDIVDNLEDCERLIALGRKAVQDLAAQR